MINPMGQYFLEGNTQAPCGVGGQFPQGLVLVNEQGKQSRAVYSEQGQYPTLVAFDWGNLQGALHPDGLILWANGSTWTRRPFPFALMGNWSSTQGGPCQVLAQGDVLVFVNADGQQSRGQAVNFGTVGAVDWNLMAQVSDQYRCLRWANGVVWSR